ncbi:hypothetical protein, partial [Acinetobacter baumannii]|uniref:hypothetical protein n=1 Tax=Acinetobacter baumannii TaxID=470 RepID=UPI0033956CC1
MENLSSSLGFKDSSMEVLEIKNEEFLIFQVEVFVLIGEFGVKVTQKPFIINPQSNQNIPLL